MDFIFYFWPAAVFGGIALAIHISIKRSDKKERLEQERNKEEQRKELLKQLEAGTWKFPVYEIEAEWEELGIMYPINDVMLPKANEIVLNHLNSYGVPAHYHSKFIGKEKINAYLLEAQQIERNQIIELLQTLSNRQSFTGITSEASYQKAKVIMENALDANQISSKRRSFYLSREQIESCFTEVAKRTQKQEERRLSRELKQMRKEEADYESQCCQWLEYVGKEKTIQYCNAQIAFLEQQIQQCKDELSGKVDETAARSMQYEQVNNNWAAHGGVASAIAGPVAGAVMAADAKRRIDNQNQKNAELSQLNMQLFLLQAQEIKSRQAKAEASLKEWEETLQSAKFALEEWQDADFLLSQINPTVSSCKVTKTGAVKLKISFGTTPGLRVYNEKPAFVDGSVLVQIKDGDKIVGTTMCCLPFKGTTKFGSGECICTQTTNPNGQYQVDFAPNKLWAMERI